MSAAALQSQFERLSVNNTGNIAKKQATAKAKEKFAIKSSVNEALGIAKTPSRAAGRAEPAEKHVKAFASKMEEAVKAKEVEKRDKLRIEKYRCLVRYFELTPDMCVGIKKPSATESEQEIDTKLAEVRGRFGGKGAKLVIDMALVSVFRAIEYACEHYGVGSLIDLETKGLGAKMMVAMHDPGFMQPERTEIYVENAHRFEQPYWVRAMFKVGQSVVAYSEGQKNARLGAQLQQPVGADTQSKYSDI